MTVFFGDIPQVGWWTAGYPGWKCIDQPPDTDKVDQDFGDFPTDRLFVKDTHVLKQDGELDEGE